MIQFLDLPREIRDLIYGYLLRSPTGYISILPAAKPARGKPSVTLSNRATATFVLVTNPLQALAKCQSGKPIYTSLSLLRACRQIHNETRHIFWAQNTLYFPSFGPMFIAPWDKKATLGVSPTLKAMGQIASRMIVSMRIDMPQPSVAYEIFGKVLHLLGSRARHGDFKRLELVWDNIAFEDMVAAQLFQDSRIVRRYMTLLSALANGSEACKYERVIRFPAASIVPTFGNLDVARTHMDIVADEVHLAFGGKLYWGEQLAWDKGERIFSVDEEHECVGPISVLD